MAMASTFTAVIRHDGPWWLGWVEEVPGVNAQERSRDKLLESCGFLHRSMGEQKRTVSLADSYQKRKWSGKLIKAGWGKECAAAAIAAMIDSEPVTMYGVEGELKWVAAMMFDDTEGYGKDIYGAINELQLKCGQEVDGKKTSVIDFLKENESKTGALVKILGGDQVPQLKNRITGLPEEGAQWHHDAGSAPWLIAAKSRAWRFGPCGMPLVGIGCFVQLCAGSPPMTFLLIPGEHLSKAGLVNFVDAPKFFETDGGAKLVRDVSLYFTLEKITQIAYIPYSVVAIPISGLYTDEVNSKSGPDISVCWHYPILNSKMAKDMSDQCWNSIVEWNKGYMTPLSGQPIWKERLDVFSKLEEGRKAA